MDFGNQCLGGLAFRKDKGVLDQLELLLQAQETSQSNTLYPS
jgi:hypothetical protein